METNTLFFRAAALGLLLSTGLQIGATTSAGAQKLLTRSATGGPNTVEAIMKGVKQRLESMGFTDVQLLAASDRITGSATKDGRVVRISVDERGHLQIE